MSQQTIDIGAAPEDGTGDPLRVAFDKSNENFTELYQTAGVASEGIWNFNATISDTTVAPVSGRFHTNSANYRDATELAIHGTTIHGIDRSSTLRTMRAGDIVQCQDTLNSAAWCRYNLLASPTDNGVWFKFSVALAADGGVASGNNQEIIFRFTANSGGGGGAPVGAEYITSTTDATLTAERVLTDTATVTWDRTTAGQIKANAVGGGGGASISISDTPPGSPTAGSMWWESDTGILWIYYNDGTSSQWVVAAGGGAFAAGAIQHAYAETTAWTTISTAMAGGQDTVPQQTDGTELLTVSITPRNVANKLKVDIAIPCASNPSNYFWVAVFRDSAAPALAAVSWYGNAGQTVVVPLSFEVTAGATSATTFKVRLGQHGAGNSIYVNGHNSSRMLGGSQRATIIVVEYAS